MVSFLVNSYMKKNRKKKKRIKKNYDIKVLRERWKIQRFDPQKHYAKVGACVGIAGVLVLILTLVMLLNFVWEFGGIYDPIGEDEAILKTAQFKRYSLHRRQITIILTNNERVYISRGLYYGRLDSDLDELAPEATLHFKFNSSGQVLEIRTDQKEILNFDFTQKLLIRMSIIIIILTIATLVILILTIIDLWKKIVIQKVFSSAMHL